MICIMDLCTSIAKTHLKSKKRYWKMCWNYKIPKRIRTIKRQGDCCLVPDASPELLHWFTEQTLQPGPAVSLKCVATGNPPPQFVWTLDGFPVPDSTR